MTARVSILLKSHASLTYFQACFLPGRAKDLTAPRYFKALLAHLTSVDNSTLPVTYESSSWQQKPEKELMPSARPLRYVGDTASHADWRMSDRSFNKQSIHLFNHHLNVMITCNISSKSKCILFAEDTSLIISHPGIGHFEKYLNDISTSLNKWFKVNKLTLKLY